MVEAAGIEPGTIFMQPIVNKDFYSTSLFFGHVLGTL